MLNQAARFELGNGYFTNDAGDLITKDKNDYEVLVVKGGAVTCVALSHQEGSVDWSIHCTHKDIDGVVHKTTHSLADLHTSARNVIRTFLSCGMQLMPGGAKFFIDFLITHLSTQRFLFVLHSGWLENSWIYVQPNWIAGEAGEPVHLELEKNCPTINSMTASGTLQEWQANVAELLRGNQLAMFCVIFAFLGPLLKLLGLEGGGVNLVGGSSIGKTTGLQCASSVYGRGSSPAADSGNSYVQTWNQTSNALEGIAAGHTDALTALDEVGLYAGGDLGSDLYLLAGGRGKVAMDSHRRLKNVSTWRGNILSTGEVGMLEAIERKGGRAKAGMLVRLIDIPVTNMFPNPPDGMTSGELSNHVKSNCATYFGTAGRAFVEFLVDELKNDSAAVVTELRTYLDQFTREMIPADATPLQERAIRRFAAIKVAGYVAVNAGVLPYTAEEIDACVTEVMDTWLTYRPSVTDVQRSLTILHDFLVRNATSLPGFKDAHAANPKAFRDTTRGLIAFTDAQFSAATGGDNIVEVAKELRRHGYLFCNETGRLKAKLKISGDTETRFYAVQRNFLEADLHRTDADDGVVVVAGNASDDDCDEI